MADYDDSDFVAVGTGIPVQFGFYNKTNGIREENIAAAKPFNTTPNTSANSHGTEETIIGDYEPEYVTSPDGQMEIVYDDYAYENDDFVSPNGEFNQDFMIQNQFQNGSRSQNSRSDFKNPSAQSGRYSEMTSMASPTKNQPFNTQTCNNAIWGEDEKATLHVDKEDNKTGLTKITINTSGGDPKIEDVTSQIGGIRPLSDPGVTIESNYQNDGQGDGGQGETNVTIKRIGGDEIKVNNGAATPSMLGRPNLKQRGNKIEVRPGVRVTQGAADMASMMQSALGGLGNPGTSSSNTGQTTSRAQQMFLARKSRSKQFEKTSIGQGTEDVYNPGQREYVSEDDDDNVYSDSDAAPTPVPTSTFDYGLDESDLGVPPVAIAAYDSIGDENMLKNLEGKDLSPIPTPNQMKGKGAGLFQKQGVRMDKYTLEKQEKERVDTLMELEKLTGNDLWQGNLDNRGNIIGVENNRAKSYTGTNVGLEEDEKYTTTSETVRNTKTTTHTTTQFQSSTNSQTTTHSTINQPVQFSINTGPDGTGEVKTNNEPFSFARPGQFQPVSNNYQAVETNDFSNSASTHVSSTTNPLSALPNAPVGLKTTFQENNAPWNASHSFGSIRAPSGPKVPQNTPVAPERKMFSNQETGPQGRTEIVMPKINPGYQIPAQIVKPDFNKAIQEIQTKKHVTFNEKTAIQPIYNDEDDEDHVYDNSLPTPAAPKPIDFTAQRNLVQNVMQQSSDVPDKQLMYTIPVNDDLIKEAVKSTHVLDVVKTGTGVVTEKQRLLLEEEAKKKKEMEKRYSMYTDFIEEDVKMKDDKGAVLNKLEMLDKKLEKNSKFEAAQPDEEFVDQGRFDDQEHVKQMGDFLPKSHLKTPNYNAPPMQHTQNSYTAPMSNFDDFQNSVFGSLQTQTEPPMSTPISSFPPPPPRPSGGALGSSQILQNLQNTAPSTPWAPSTGYQPVKLPTLPSPRNSSSSDISFKKIQGYTPSKAWTPSTVKPVSDFKVPGKYNLDVPVVLPDTTPILPPQVPISNLPPPAPPVPGTEYKPIKKAGGNYSPSKPNQQFNTPKPAVQNFNSGGPVMMPVDFTKGKGAKMFEKQQARMGKYTRTIGDEKAKDIKQAHLSKKKAIEDGTYMPSHGPAPMASVLPTGPPVSRPSQSSSRPSNSSNRPVAPAQRKSVIPPSSSKINSYNAPMGSLNDFMASVGGSLAPQQGSVPMGNAGMDFTNNQAAAPRPPPIQQQSAAPTSYAPTSSAPTSYAPTSYAPPSSKPMNDYSAPMSSLDDFMASVGGSTAMGMDFATKLMK